MDKPEMLVRINRERAASLGIDVQEIAETLRIAVGGDDRVSRYRDASLDDAYDVELRLVGLDRGNKQAISQLYVRATSRGGSPHPRRRRRSRAGTNDVVLARLDNVVQFQDDNSPSRIDRLDRQRMVALRANVAGGYALGDRIDAMRQAAEELGLPPGVTTQGARAAARSWSARSRTSPGRSCSRSSSCTSCWRRSSSTWCTRSRS